MIAHTMDKSDRTSATYSLNKWAANARVSTRRLQSITKFLEKSGKLILKLDGLSFTIDYPNLLKYRDEYTKKKEKEYPECPDTVRIKSGATPDQETETETETETDKNIRDVSSSSFFVKGEPQHKKNNQANTPVFDFWRETMEKPRAQFDTKRKRVIERALKPITQGGLGFSQEDCFKAILGCKKSEWHMGIGKDSKGLKYNDLELILRDSKRIEQFIEMESQKYTKSDNQSPADRIESQAKKETELKERQRAEEAEGKMLEEKYPEEFEPFFIKHIRTYSACLLSAKKRRNEALSGARAVLLN
jgi:hypothetical protein